MCNTASTTQKTVMNAQGNDKPELTKNTLDATRKLDKNDTALCTKKEVFLRMRAYV